MKSSTDRSTRDSKGSDAVSGGEAQPGAEEQAPALGQPSSVMGTGLTLLLALIGGFAIGNLYWAQPLLGVIAGDLASRPERSARSSPSPRSATPSGSF